MKLEFQLFDFAEFKAKMQQLKEKKHFDYLARKDSDVSISSKIRTTMSAPA